MAVCKVLPIFFSGIDVVQRVSYDCITVLAVNYGIFNTIVLNVS